MADKDLQGLDYYFLRYIDVNRETQKRNQGFYVPFFEECRRVVDLGCGDGDFVELLMERGKEALGVDSDMKAYEMALARGLPVIHQDAFTYLEGLPPGQLDGIFSSHLVEHLHFEEVLRLFELANRALRPGGVLIATTPDVRGLYSHLEMFWLHFGHVCFYHPRLLCFFLERTGFAEPELGENPYTASPLMSDLRACLSEARTIGEPPWQPSSGQVTAPQPPAERRLPIPVDYERVLPLQGKSWWRRVSQMVKMVMARMIVLPYLDQLVSNVNNVLDQTDRALDQTDRVLATTTRTLLNLDRPFECYVSAKKPMEFPETQDGD